MKRILLKLSGEALAGAKKTGFDEETVIAVAKQIRTIAEEGTQTGIVIGLSLIHILLDQISSTYSHKYQKSCSGEETSKNIHTFELIQVFKTETAKCFHASFCKQTQKKNTGDVGNFQVMVGGSVYKTVSYTHLS